MRIVRFGDSTEVARGARPHVTRIVVTGEEFLVEGGITAAYITPEQQRLTNS